MFPPAVERWRTVAHAESRGIPTDLILAIIQNESRGRPGLIARRRTRIDVPLPTDDGGSIACGRALGLMQVVPQNVRAWNQRTGEAVTYNDMTGGGYSDARKQIKLGVSVLRGCLFWLHVRDADRWPWPAGQLTNDQIRLALVAYAWGQRRLGKKLNILRSEGEPETFAALARRWPSLGEPANQPLVYVSRVTRAITQSGEGEITPTPGSILLASRKKKGPLGGLILVAAIAAVLLPRK